MGIRYVLRIEEFDVKKGAKKKVKYEGARTGNLKIDFTPAKGEARALVYDIAGKKPKELVAKSFEEDWEDPPLFWVVTAGEENERIDGPDFVTNTLLRKVVSFGKSEFGKALIEQDTNYIYELFDAEGIAFLEWVSLRPLSGLPRYAVLNILDAEALNLKGRRSSQIEPGQCPYCLQPLPEENSKRCPDGLAEQQLCRILEKLMPRSRGGEWPRPPQTLTSAPATIKELRGAWARRAQAVRDQPISMGWFREDPPLQAWLVLVILSDEPPDPELIRPYLTDDEFAARLQGGLSWLEWGGNQAEATGLKRGTYLVKATGRRIDSVLESKRRLSSWDLEALLARIASQRTM